ncbi:MAG: biotin transporter BioY [Candidatus Goldbacteria bacterium]|nr:biotin transporter BioY [Candidatus Goldiibacteriota bacterium]
MNNLVKTLTKDIIIDQRIENIFKILLFSFLMFVGSLIKVYLPYTPVPITLQTFFLFISIYYLSPKQVGMSQTLYIIAGLIGLPVFAAGITGMLSLIGPTAGYLLGFIVAGVIMSILKEKIKTTVLNMFYLFILGTIIIYFFGIIHLCIIYKINISAAIKIGALPFIIGDLIKISIASMISLKNRI